MQIGIIGCGWLGERVANFFSQKNHPICTTNKSTKKAHLLSLKGYQAFSVDFCNEAIDKTAQEALLECDIIIISVSISSQKEVFKRLCAFLKGATAKNTFFFSTIGVYPNNNTIVSEATDSSLLVPKFLINEKEVLHSFPNTNILRLGGLFGDNRMYSNYFNTKTLNEADIPVNHVHYLDICRIINQLITHNIKGKIYNIVAPLHPTKKEVILSQSDLYKTPLPSKMTNGITNHKIVSCSKIINDLKYDFLFPDPRLF